VKRVLLLLPTGTYRAPDFLAAASRLGVEVVVGSERRQAMAVSMGDRALVVPIGDLDAAVAAIADLHGRSPLDAVVAVDDQGVVVGAAAAQRLGLHHNPVPAVSATRDKAAMRRCLSAAAVPQPAFEVVEGGLPDDVVSAASRLGYPCVVKPVDRSGSQGVIRVDDAVEARRAAARVGEIVGECSQVLIVERFVPGAEVALEGLLTDGRLDVLAIFDKPDPLDGPFFEETIYVTPSTHPEGALVTLAATVERAASALGLREGPVHAEARLDPAGSSVILELAARSIGGLCSRTLRFGAGISLEEIVLRHALGLGIHELHRETGASGVMMLPIRSGGILEEVAGVDRARSIEGVVGVEITIAAGRPVVPLPEGDRYLGFIFARGDDPAAVDGALRQAEAYLDVRLRST
jgi:biotin carboxylase